MWPRAGEPLRETQRLGAGGGPGKGGVQVDGPEVALPGVHTWSPASPTEASGVHGISRGEGAQRC